jgi:8-hydroxy-5-deazaflavin:NADPH oxidoreductase
MDIAIIGTGNVGRALATSLTRAGHDVTLAARDEAKAQTVAGEVGAHAVAEPRDAVARSEVVILAVPYAAAADVAREIAPVAAGKVVIDASNPLKPDLSGLANAGGASIAEQLVPLLPGATVVKAFNTLFASVQADPTALGVTVDGFFATDDDAARAPIAQLLESISLRPVDAGALINARALEAIAFLNIKLQVEHGGTWDSAFVMVAPPEAAVALSIAA